MKKHIDCIRGYHRYNKSWYAQPNEKITVGFGLYHKDGGTSGEMSMAWYELGKDLCARLESFEDSWSVLSTFPDLIEELSKVDSGLIQEEDFVEILNKCGFKDLTQYKRYEN